MTDNPLSPHQLLKAAEQLAAIAQDAVKAAEPVDPHAGKKVLAAFVGICAVGLGAMAVLGGIFHRTSWQNRESFKAAVNEALDERHGGIGR